MSSSSLLRDTVSLVKQNGEVTNDIKASVQKKKIFIHRPDILIESGDFIKRSMSNGAEELFEVIDPGFHESFHGIPAGYQIDVKKVGIPEATKPVSNITYNINGDNTRINQNSVDNSTNIANSNQNIIQLISSLREEIMQLDLGAVKKKEAFEVVDAIESQANSESPSKTVISSLLSALPQAANIASVGSLILSLLG